MCAGALLLFASLGCAPSRTHSFSYDCGAPVRGDVADKALALVFSGGSYGEGTAHILDGLQRFDAQASFFVTGEFLTSPRHRALVQRMVTDGHYVGPHSHGHPLYCAWDDRAHTLVTATEFKADLARNIADLRELGALQLGTPVYFLPPYEWFNADQVAWAREMNVILFNFTPGSGSNRDWIPEGGKGFVPSARITDDILAYERRDPHGLNDFILLLHLGSQRRDKMHAQIEPLLRALRSRGYSFLRVDDMLRGLPEWSPQIPPARTTELP